MLRSAALASSLVVFCALLSGHARASGAWLSNASLTPVEQRVAVAIGPQRTTLWTSLRFNAAGGPMGIIVPAPPGAALDISSDAWFEALEVATAPRILPPANESPFCPGKSGSPSILQIDGQTSHLQSLAPQDVALLDDVAAVKSWAVQGDLMISSKLETALGNMNNVRFVAVRFNAPPGSGVTPTLRISMPGQTSVLPLALTHASGADLRVTSWVIGPGESDLIGGVKGEVSTSSLRWDATTEESNYDELRAQVLDMGTDAFLVESASHESLVDNQHVGSGNDTIDGVVTTFFERAAAYGDGNFDAPTCVMTAMTSLGSANAVSAACPRAALGVVDPAPTCTESTTPPAIDPGTLRCGPGADDLAVALSGAVPKDTWLTRQSMVIPSGNDGADWYLDFVTVPPTSPVLTAAHVDVSTCGDGGVHTGATTGATTSTTGSGHPTTGSGHPSSGSGPVGASGSVYLDLGDTFDSSSCDCSGTEASSSDSTDSCSSGDSSTDSCSSSSDGSSSDSCSGDGGDACSSSGGDSGCSSSSGDSCSGGGDSCSGGGDACSGGGDLFKCTTAGSKRRGARGPRLSIVLMAALAVLAPLRRRGRRRRGARASS